MVIIDGFLKPDPPRNDPPPKPTCPSIFGGKRKPLSEGVAEVSDACSS